MGCRVMSHEIGPGGNPYITTHDGRTIRFPDPDVKANDTILVNLETGKIENKCKFEDSAGNNFCTRMNNVMVVGPASEGGNAWISLPKGKGIKLTDIEDRAQRMQKGQK